MKYTTTEGLVVSRSGDVWCLPCLTGDYGLEVSETVVPELADLDDPQTWERVDEPLMGWGKLDCASHYRYVQSSHNVLIPDHVVSAVKGLGRISSLVDE